MHRLLALFLLVLPLVAQDPAPGAFIGAGLGKDRRFMVDLGLSSGNVQTTAWGGHMGFMSRSSDTSDNSGSTYYTSKAPGAYTDTVDFQAFQLGVYAEVGRAWAALGVEHASETTRSYVVQPDRTWAVQPEANKSGAGGYLKAGLKLSACSIYVGYGTRSEFVAGLGLHF